jgi:hypothetical protein
MSTDSESGERTKATRKGMTMRDYKIKLTAESMIITERATGDRLAEYRTTPGRQGPETAQMRRAINKHLRNGGVLHNYQW